MKPIPDEAVSKCIAALGKTGSGKTFAIKAALVEPLLEAGKRVGIVDPTGAWWGLRSSRDGKSPGFPILVLGGDHGDLPLPALGGAAVARLLVEQGVNLVADTSDMTTGERTRWMIDFAGTLYRLNRTPLHLIIDEAHNFAPKGKIPDPEVGKMLHATNMLASGGRSRGIRLTMITQRSQKLHNDTLTCADTLIAMRMLAPADRGAVEDWIKGCGDIEQGKAVLNSLASLQRGEGWVWYPEGSYLKRLKFPEIKTFDSSATPEEGKATAGPKRAADIDMTEIKAALADAVKEAEARDPKLLQKKIEQLQRDIAEADRTTAKPVVDHEAMKRAEIAGYERGKADAFGSVLQLAEASVKHACEVSANMGTIVQIARESKESVKQVQNIPKLFTDPVKHKVQFNDTGSAEEIGNSGLRRILIALAQSGKRLTAKQIGVRAGMSSGSGTFGTYLSKARSEGWINGGRDGIEITPMGLKALGGYDPLPSGGDLLQYWLRELGDSGAARILATLASAYPGTLTKEEVGSRARLSSDSGTFGTYLSKLRTLELVSGKGNLCASPDLF